MPGQLRILLSRGRENGRQVVNGVDPVLFNQIGETFDISAVDEIKRTGLLKGGIRRFYMSGSHDIVTAKPVPQGKG